MSAGRATIGRWGRSLAVRLPAEIASETGLGEGQKVELFSQGRDIVIRPLAPMPDAETLFQGRSPQEWRDLYAGSFDWGPDLGREIVDE